MFFIDFYRKIKNFGPKKYKIMKKLKTLLISRNWFCDLHLLFSYQLFQNFENTPNTVFRQAFLLIQYSFIYYIIFFLFRQRISIFF